jgi:hypothetical protein
LHTTYAAFLKVLSEKLKWFVNITPDRIKSLTLNECQHMCELIPNLTSPPLLFTEFQLLSDQIKECDGMNGITDRDLQNHFFLVPVPVWSRSGPGEKILVPDPVPVKIFC